jgi:two-component system LytT family response regulator
MWMARAWGRMSDERLRALVVDGDLGERRPVITHLLAAHADIRVIGECDAVPFATVALRELRPELLFLDLQLPDADSLVSADGMGARTLPVIITTSDSVAALRAYEAGRLSYRIQPLNDAGLRALLRDARVLIRGRRASLFTNSLTVRVDHGLMVVNAADINWIEGAQGQVRLHATGGTQPVRESFRDFERLLDPKRFVRVHRSAIVNMDRVWSVQPYRKGRCVLVLDNGARIITGVARASLVDMLRQAF